VDQSGAESVGDHFRDPGISVAKRIHRDSACKIEISLAIGVDQFYALAPHQLHRRTLVGRKEG